MQLKPDGKVIFFQGKKYQVKDLKIGDVVGDPKSGFKYLGGTGKWMNFRNLQTGEETVKTHNPKKISKWDTCEHQGNWKLIDSNGNIQCTKCGFGQRIVWGKQIVKKGKLLNLRPKKTKN
jgi:hypothetical protein